jgi:uncharacterized RDD family membrane protein YckC
MHKAQSPNQSIPRGAMTHMNPQKAPSILRRMACFTYEGILIFGVVFISGLIFTMVTDALMPSAVNDPFSKSLAYRSLFQAFIFCVLTTYFIYFWRRGQTLAMKTWRIELLDQEGQHLSTRMALKRWVSSWVWFIPPLMALTPFSVSMSERVVLCLGWISIWATLARFQSHGQFWHDVWSQTQLVEQDEQT